MRERRDPRFMRRPGMGQSGMDLGYGMPAVQEAPLLRPAPDPLAMSRRGPSRPIPILGSLTRAHALTLESQRQVTNRMGTGDRMISADYLNWVPSEAGGSLRPDVTSDDPIMLDQPVVAATSRPAADASKPRQSLEDLVTNHLTAMRRSYMESGWRRFRTGDYQGALRMFCLAENAGLDKPAERACAEMATVYTGIAAGQFAQAANALEWLVSDSSQLGQRGYPEAFNRIFDDNNASTMADLYVTPDGLPQTGEYQARNSVVETLAAANPDVPVTRALLAMVKWGRGERASAIDEASNIKDPGQKLSNLATVMREAERLRQWHPASGRESSSPAASLGLPSAGTQPAQ